MQYLRQPQSMRDGALQNHDESYIDGGGAFYSAARRALLGHRALHGVTAGLVILFSVSCRHHRPEPVPMPPLPKRVSPADREALYEARRLVCASLECTRAGETHPIDPLLDGAYAEARDAYHGHRRQQNVRKIVSWSVVGASAVASLMSFLVADSQESLADIFENLGRSGESNRENAREARGIGIVLLASTAALALAAFVVDLIMSGPEVTFERVYNEVLSDDIDRRTTAFRPAAGD